MNKRGTFYITICDGGGIRKEPVTGYQFELEQLPGVVLFAHRSNINHTAWRISDKATGMALMDPSFQWPSKNKAISETTSFANHYPERLNLKLYSKHVRRARRLYGKELTK